MYVYVYTYIYTHTHAYNLQYIIDSCHHFSMVDRGMITHYL